MTLGKLECDCHCQRKLTMQSNPLTQPLSEFSITGLHGERNIKIPFDGPVKILVAENGYGKTTVLNTLYALISGNFQKLRTTQFESISLKFKSGKEVALDKIDLALNFDASTASGMAQHFRSHLQINELNSLFDAYKTLSIAELKISPHFTKALKTSFAKFNISDETLIQWLDALSRETGNTNFYSPKIIDCLTIIREEFPFEIIYLPTYRRVEEDIKNLIDMPVDLALDKNFIQFGMQDVIARFKSITAEIKNSSIQWFAKVNGQMLVQLIHGVLVDKEMKASLADKDALRIVLERIGDNITASNKEHILLLIENGNILLAENEPLAYFLANLVKVYEQQRENDNAIKKFTTTSNFYLADKRVVYDESAVEISIQRKKNGHVVDINTLSSGEKQILSLFSRLFLTKSKEVAIFFDEPELSLSIEWQKRLLPNIIDSGTCRFLFCTTHSPFIFENELLSFTSGLDRYIEEL
jgi:predicted ATPase